jgi:hypothetical protein
MNKRVVPVERHVDDHAAAAQPGRDRPGQQLVILGNQHSHVLGRKPGSRRGDLSASR